MLNVIIKMFALFSESQYFKLKSLNHLGQVKHLSYHKCLKTDSNCQSFKNFLQNSTQSWNIQKF